MTYLLTTGHFDFYTITVIYDTIMLVFIQFYGNYCCLRFILYRQSSQVQFQFTCTLHANAFTNSIQCNTALHSKTDYYQKKPNLLTILLFSFGTHAFLTICSFDYDVQTSATHTWTRYSRFYKFYRAIIFILSIINTSRFRFL